MKNIIPIFLLFIACNNNNRNDKLDIRMQQYEGIMKLSLPYSFVVNTITYYEHSDYNRNISFYNDYKIKLANDTYIVKTRSTLNLANDSIYPVSDSIRYYKMLDNLRDGLGRNSIVDGIKYSKKTIAEGNLYILNYSNGCLLNCISNKALVRIEVRNLKDKNLRDEIINSVSLVNYTWNDLQGILN